MKLPKKKENDRQRMEYNEELYGMRKKFHQVRTTLNCSKQMWIKMKCVSPYNIYSHHSKVLNLLSHYQFCVVMIESQFKTISV